MVEAPPENLKVTTPLDLRVAEALLAIAVLTDYHVHLRPDEDGTPPPSYFTPANAERYREAAAERGIEELGVSEHVHRFTQALDVWDHPGTGTGPRDDLDDYCAFVREDTDLRLGIEADFLPGREDRLANLLDGARRGTTWWARCTSCATRRWTCTEPSWSWDIWRSRDPEKVWPRYFETLGEAARSGLFDILAHPDLVKVWGGGVPLPEATRAASTSCAMDGIAESDVAIEVSTAGLRKPVGEIYPARASWRCAWRRASRWRCPATPTSPSTSATSTSARVELAARRSA